MLESGRTLADLLACSMHLVTAPCDEVYQEEEPAYRASTKSKERKVIRHKVSVIDHFIRHARSQGERMDALEAKLD